MNAEVCSIPTAMYTGGIIVKDGIKLRVVRCANVIDIDGFAVRAARRVVISSRYSL